MPEWTPRNTARARELRSAATPAERLLWHYLSRSQCGVKFSRQMPIGPYFADFLCRRLRLVVELDGESHDLRPGHDARRDAWMHAEGYVVLRFLNEDVLAEVEAVVVAICEVITDLQRRQAHPDPSRKREGDNQRNALPSRLREGQRGVGAKRRRPSGHLVRQSRA